MKDTMSARQPSFDKRTPAWMRRIALFLENDKTMKLVEWAAILLFLATASGSYFLLNSQSGRTDFISPPLTAALLVVNLIPPIFAGFTAAAVRGTPSSPIWMMADSFNFLVSTWNE